MGNTHKLERAIVEALREPTEIVDSEILVAQELDGFMHPTKIKFGDKDAETVAKRIIRKLRRNNDGKRTNRPNRRP